MNKNTSTFNKQWDIVFFVFFLVLFISLLFPVIIYISKFGFNISDDHKIWAEFGSAMSGIYPLILSVFTLIILVVQLFAQAIMNKNQQDYNYLKDTKEELHFYIDKLSIELTKDYPNNINIKDAINSFAYNDINSDNIKEKANALSLLNNNLTHIWGSIIICLIGLDSNEHEIQYKLYLQNSISKLMANFSLLTCIALDNYHYTCLDKYRLSKYYFNNSLNQ
jgi:hypothetical protein